MKSTFVVLMYLTVVPLPFRLSEENYPTEFAFEKVTKSDNYVEFAKE